MKEKTHLKELEGKSKAEKKRIRQEYEEAKKRLEKKQSKYVTKENKMSRPMSNKEKKKAEAKRLKRYNDRVWRGWRESDNQVSPVKTYRLEDLKKGED
ncbi:hypothetical protein [Bacillus sonorensis]|uniref:hypothetical protein n=1 Tax=Bacillus sonorensis TaxID=119858 RepID=UPI002DBB3055|nr:hypothetical protein [Bacillus sonorensis]MEC0341865.1 hypothetical protein [Bacillus sonorensis]MEC0457449.1 hypothetical protein [Bacillus sonorensis]MEC0530756.1 hypothetical protein [Bacillus sonorensis]